MASLLGRLAHGIDDGLAVRRHIVRVDVGGCCPLKDQAAIILRACPVVMPMTAAGMRALFAAGRAAGGGILICLRARSGTADGSAHAHADILQVDGAGLADVVGSARDIAGTGR